MPDRQTTEKFMRFMQTRLIEWVIVLQLSVIIGLLVMSVIQ